MMGMPVRLRIVVTLKCVSAREVWIAMIAMCAPMTSVIRFWDASMTPIQWFVMMETPVPETAFVRMEHASDDGVAGAKQRGLWR